MSYLFIFFVMQAGIGIGDSDGQLGCSFHSGFAFLGGDTVNDLSTVRFFAPYQHFKLVDIVDQELPEAQVLYFLVAPIPDVEHQDLTLESPAHPVFTASGFLPVTFNFDMLV